MGIKSYVTLGNVIILFTAIIFLKARVFVPAKYFQSSIMFAWKAGGAYNSEAPFKLPALSTIIRLGWKCLPGKTL
jgi:hypothetical protein